MTLEDLGYTNELEAYRKENGLDAFDVGRVISEHRERYAVKTANQEYDAEIIGNLRYTAQNRSDFPAVGDWVAFTEYDDGKALIHSVLPRKTVLERQAVGKKGEKQIIATNIDYALIVQAVDRDFNINRIERYLAICHTSGVKPIIALNKIDLVSDEELSGLMAQVNERIKDIQLFPVSNESSKGIKYLSDHIEKGKTYCLLGSSGVGKSSLLNSLSGRQLMMTDAISSSTHKGRHVTTHRELIVLENGGIVIDNPGMREVGIVDTPDGLELTFDQIAGISDACRYTDCTHTSETGCAVIEAVENGELDESSYQNYLKMEREKAHFESTIAERRKREKGFGKMVKSFKKIKKINRD